MSCVSSLNSVFSHAYMMSCDLLLPSLDLFLLKHFDNNSTQHDEYIVVLQIFIHNKTKTSFCIVFNISLPKNKKFKPSLMIVSQIYKQGNQPVTHRM